MPLVWVVVAAFTMTPIPESIIMWHSSLFVVGYAVSLIQLAGEYWLVAQPGRKAGSVLSAWWWGSALRRVALPWYTALTPDWTRLQPVLNPLLKGSGYLMMAVCTLNPFPLVPIFSRTVAVGIWRATGLKGSLWLIVVCTFIRLLLVTTAIGYLLPLLRH